MTYDERTVVHRDVVDGDPVDPRYDRGTAVTSRTVETRPSGGAVAGRIVVFVFGLIQVVILLRIVLLLLDAPIAPHGVSGRQARRDQYQVSLRRRLSPPGAGPDGEISAGRGDVARRGGEL